MSVDEFSDEEESEGSEQYMDMNVNMHMESASRRITGGPLFGFSSVSKAISQPAQLSRPPPPPVQTAMPFAVPQDFSFGQVQAQEEPAIPAGAQFGPPQVTLQAFCSVANQAPHKAPKAGLFDSTAPSTVQGGLFDIPPPPAPPQAQSDIPLPGSQSSLFGQSVQAERTSEAATGGLFGSSQFTQGFDSTAAQGFGSTAAQGFGSMAAQVPQTVGGGFSFGGLFGSAAPSTVQGGWFDTPPPPPLPPPVPSQSQSATLFPVSQGSSLDKPAQPERKSKAAPGGLFGSPQLKGFGSTAAQVPQKAGGGFRFGGLFGSAAPSTVQGGWFDTPPPPPPPVPSQSQSATLFPASQGSSLGKPAQAERKSKAAPGGLFGSPQISLGSTAARPRKAPRGFRFGKPSQTGLFGSAAPSTVEGGLFDTPPPPPPPAPSQAQSAIPLPVSQRLSLVKPAQRERKPKVTTGLFLRYHQIAPPFGSVSKQQPEKAVGGSSFGGQPFGSAAPPPPPPPPPPPAPLTEEHLTSAASPSGFGAPANLVKEKRRYETKIEGAMPTDLLESMSTQLATNVVLLRDRDRERPKGVSQYLGKPILRKKEVASVEIRTEGRPKPRAPPTEAPEEPDLMEAEQQMEQTPPRLLSKSDALLSGGQSQEKAPPAPPSVPPLPPRSPPKSVDSPQPPPPPPSEIPIKGFSRQRRACASLISGKNNQYRVILNLLLTFQDSLLYNLNPKTGSTGCEINNCLLNCWNGFREMNSFFFHKGDMAG